MAKSYDPNVWMQWLEEMNSDEEFLDCDSDISDTDKGDNELSSLHDSDTEQEASEDEESDTDNSIEDFIGKDGSTKWRKNKLRPNVKISSKNIITRLPGPKGIAKEAKTEIDALQLFIDEEIVKLITSCTNAYIEKVKNNFTRERDARPTDETEIKALIGILYFIGTRRSSRMSTSKMWDNSKGSGIEICYLAISEQRFRFLMRCLRFDDHNTRAERRKSDKLAPIREVFEAFVKKFQCHFTPGEYMTVDEQLLAFRGKCSFRQFIPSKPAKYGIKVFALVDSRMKYTINLEIYCGKQEPGQYLVSNAAQDIVLRLAKPLYGSNRNITGDNWFSSIPLVDALLEKKLTYVGTLRKNKRELPKEFLPSKTKQLNTSIFGFQKNKTLVSYTERQNKSTILISSMHENDEIDEETGGKCKPEIVTFYNRTKVGVDVVDQLCSNYNVARNTRRWPAVIFFDLLNISGINAMCIFSANHGFKKIKRDDFIESFCWELLKPQIERRTQTPQVPVEIRKKGAMLLRIEEPKFCQPEQRPSGSRGRCRICGRSRNKTTRKSCVKCQNWVCPDHSVNICIECNESE